jgi:serine/threonine protein kinase/WD40 repeat protein
MNQETLFHEALARPAAERAAFLDAACAGRPELRTAVEALLAAHEASGSFLDQPAIDPNATSAHDGPVPMADERPPDAPGTILAGRYKLLEMIGEGGMGAVWMAQQQEPVKRLVAVKLIKAGMDSRAVLARFEAERQALALMDHPNIAKVLDAGAALDGRPFFVMELVKGTPITQFCDQRRLTPRQRLELFVPVCQAIQHAHQKGIIHRDIKPSNVLVALYDDRPVPKVIDFGIAKATGQQLTDKTLHTAFGVVVGTLEYMSPEQASFNQLDIDTRSDVYGLGVLLYELLAGGPPFGRKELEKAGVLEMLRVIREQEPSRPSAKLSTADALPSIAANRGTEPKKLTGLVRGELDWLVMKALAKDRGRRYDTANSFAADIQRYLAGEPVQAAPPSTAYRLRKFVLKHRAALLVSAIVFLGLVAGVVGISIGLVEAVAARTKAEQAGDRLREANDKQWNTLYAAQCTLISNAWEAKQYDRVRELLAKQVPTDQQRDLRGFEWYYLDRQLNAAVLSVPVPRASVREAAISPDGARSLRMFHQPDESWLKAFDTTTGKEVFAIHIPGNWGRMPSFSPDGKRMVLEMPGDEKTPPPQKFSLRMWDTQTGAELQTIRGLKSVQRPAAGAEGRFVVWGELVEQGPTPIATVMRIRVWDTATGKELDSPIKPLQAGPIRAVSPDGQALVVSQYKHETPVAVPLVGKAPPVMAMGAMELEVKVLEVLTGKELLSVPATDVECVAFSPDSKRLLVGGKMLNVWDIGSGTKLLEVRERTAAAAFSPNGAWIAYLPANDSGEAFDAKVREVGTGRVRRIVKGHEGPLLQVAFSPDGARLITAGSDRIKHWDATVDDRLAAQPIGLSVHCSPNGRRRVQWPGVGAPRALAGLGKDAQGKAFQVCGEGDKPIFTVPLFEKGNIVPIFSPDGRRLVFRGLVDLQEGDQLRTQAKLRLWDVDAPREVLEVTESGRFTTAFSLDGRRLAALVESSRSTVRAWDTDSGRDLFTLPVAAGDLAQLAFSPDGAWLAVLGEDGAHSLKLTVRDAGNGREVVSTRHSLPADRHWRGPLALSSQGPRVAVPLSSADRFSPTVSVRVWAPTSEGPPMDLKGLKGGVSDLAFSPDGQRLAVLSGTNTLSVWGPDTGAELLRITLPSNHHGHVSFAADGRSLRVGLRNMDTGEYEFQVLDATPR